ncbi:hypothetical protein [Abyssogena phaseoliformis symbiont]|uniref:hypothetical protein n=1 Tax=Abyssogena phaseoliformis symbiont TaxID=596095 RepID=UPI00191596E5|nr:hypothetical protein [Abyssogena phaseoliformis symbiont]
MNKILKQFIDEQTPEQIQEAFTKIREKRGYYSNDISVEDALGISIESKTGFQYPKILSGATISIQTSDVSSHQDIWININNVIVESIKIEVIGKSIDTGSVSCSNKGGNIYENATNQTPYSVAA